MGTSALGWSSLVPSATMSEGSAASGLDAGNLQGDQCAPSTGWQTADGVMVAADGATVTATFAASGQTVRAVALVNTNLTAGASITVDLVNAPSTVVATKTIAGPPAGYGQAVALFSADHACDLVEISIDDAGNPDNHINIGGLFVGPLWVPATGAAWDTAFGRDHRVDEATSIGGQEHPIYRWQRRRWEISLGNIQAPSELWDDQQELDRIARQGGNILFIPDINSTELAREAVYGRLTATSDVTYPYKNTTRRAWRARITERL